MTQTHEFPWAIAAEFLGRYAERLCCAGCNDYELPDTLANRALWAAACIWQCEPDDEPWGVARGPSGGVYVNDAMLVEYLAEWCQCKARGEGAPQIAAESATTEKETP